MAKEKKAECISQVKTDSKEFLFNFQKAILLSLHENGKLTFEQYNYAIELLEKKFKN